MNQRDKVNSEVMRTEALSLEDIASSQKKIARELAASDYDLSLAYNVAQNSLTRLAGILHRRADDLDRQRADSQK
jgi:hypothetical protein